MNYFFRRFNQKSIATLFGLATLFLGGQNALANEPEELPIPIERFPEIESVIMPTPVLIQTIPAAHHARVSNLIFYPTNPEILISGGGKNDGDIKFWNWQQAKHLWTRRGQSSGIASMVLSADAQWLVSTGSDREVHLWTLPEGEFAHTLKADFYNLLAVAITPDNRTLISGGLDGIRLWSIGNQRSRYTLARFLPVSAIAPHPNGEWLASGTTTGEVQLWNIETGQRLSTLGAHRQAVTSVAFTPNGDVLITAGRDRDLKLWDLTNAAAVRTLADHVGEIGAIALHPTQPMVAVAAENWVYVWDWQQANLLGVWELAPDWISSLAWSPNGQQLATGDLGGEIRIWQWRLSE